MTLLSVSLFDLVTSSFFVLLVASFLVLLGGGGTGLIDVLDEVDFLETFSTESVFAFKVLLVSDNLDLEVLIGFSLERADTFSFAWIAPAA